MSAARQEQEFTPERNGQENSPSHSAQDSGDSDSDTVRERAPERDMSFSFQVAPRDWFTDYMSVIHNKMDRQYETIQRNEQSADFRYTSLKKQIESVQQQVCDNANAISRILQNRCDPKMSTPSTVGSDNTDVKRCSQYNRPVATTTTLSQQPSVCSTVKSAPPVYHIFHTFRLLHLLVFHIRLLQVVRQVVNHNLYYRLLVTCLFHHHPIFPLPILPLKICLKQGDIKIRVL